LKKKISIYTASAIVIANMIGTGVFTSVGFQLSSIQNTWAIILLWVVGGLLALFGAFAYAELGTHFKESGGDYIYLSRVFHPILGYLSAWAGLTVGFSAPVALAAMAFTKYLAPFGLKDNLWLAIGVIVLIGLMHSFTIKHSSRFQNISTIIKIVFIVVLIFLGFFITNTHAANAIVLDNSWHKDIVSPGFAVSMVYVSFAYVGWNTAAYVVDEIDNPRKNLPKALIGSAIFVSVVYVLFQIVLLKNATASALVGKEEVTYIAFNNLLGSTGGKWVSVFIAIQLVATLSSYLWVGPRVTHAMASEHKLWQPLAKKNKHGIPVMAVWLHVVISIILALTGKFEKILLYTGFVLQLMGSLTVASSLFIKNKDAASFTSPFKPVLQIVFLLFNVGVLIFTFIDRPTESLIGIGILLLGLVIYYFDKPVVKIEN
jgi:basic amino acid/polyamine antiporter, APA family